jgi:hypothetical protein
MLTAEIICRNPFRLGLPDSATPIRAEINAQAAKLLAQWQGTIAATMQRQAQEEGHKGLLPHAAPIGVAQPPHRRAETDNAILDALRIEPLNTAGIAMRANLPDGTVAYALARLRKAGRVTLTGSGHYSKWFVNMAPSAARILALLQDNPRSPVKAIAETLLLSGEHVRGLLVGLCESGDVVVEKENLQPKGWRNVYSVKT